MSRFFPYRVLTEPIGLVAETPRVDGMRPSISLTAGQRTIDLSGLNEWRRVSIRMRADLPSVEMMDYTDVAVTLSVNCAATNLRMGVQMARSARQDSWSGELEIEAGALAKRATLQAVVTATVAGEPKRFIGVSEPWKIWIATPEVPQFSGDLEVKWADFTKNESRPQVVDPAFSDLGHYVDITSDPPVIYLNEGVPDLRRLFDDVPNRNVAERAIRDAYFHSIAVSGWLSMFNASLGAVEQESDDQVVWPDNAWQSQVLETLLPRIYPDQQVESSIRQAYEDDQDPYAARLLQSRATAAINAMLREPQKLRRTIRVLTEEAL
jgi:hypothetical protein